MRLDAQDRHTLFMTPLPVQQLQKFLFKRQGHYASVEEIRELFSDLSKGAFNSMLISAKARGIIKSEGNTVTLVIEHTDIQTSYTDIIWKDIRILKTFTVSQIREDTGLSKDKIRTVLRTFCDQNLIVRGERKHGFETSYTLATDAITRPVNKKKTKPCLADRVYEVVQTFEGPFTREDINAALNIMKIKVSEKYLKELIVQWKYEGIIEGCTDVKPGVFKHYRLISDRPRPKYIYKSVIYNKEVNK